MPAIDPDLDAELAKAVLNAYSEAVTSLLKVVKRRLLFGINEPGWAEVKLAQLNELRKEAAAVVNAIDTGALIDAAVGASYEAGAGAAALEVAEATLVGPSIISDTTAVKALQREAVKNVVGTHARILRETTDIYRSVIAEVADQVVVGAAVRRQAASTALKRHALQGVTGFVDKSGRNWNLASYVEMATRTATKRAQVFGRVNQYEADGRELVIVSNSPEECKLCRPWEGKVLRLKASTPGRQPTLDKAIGAGLFHPNCRHDIRVFIPGLSTPIEGTADPAGDLQRQQQRNMERGIRQWKRAEVAAMTEKDSAFAKAKVAEWRKKLDTHVKTNNRKRLPHRESIRQAR
tara:strand:+ start:4012 stop:5058 length:1047 start_codon:yes stop_codon:yes gene_type:complete